VRLNVSPDGLPFLPFAEGNFGTASGKCEFRAETLAYMPPVESRLGDAALLRNFPLELISPKNHDSMNSTFGNRADVDAQTAVATIHPMTRRHGEFARATRSGFSIGAADARSRRGLKRRFLPAWYVFLRSVGAKA